SPQKSPQPGAEKLVTRIEGFSSSSWKVFQSFMVASPRKTVAVGAAGSYDVDIFLPGESIMQRTASFFLLLLTLTSSATPQASSKEKPTWPSNPNVAATEPLRPEEQKKKIKLPPGFELQLVAAD